MAITYGAPYLRNKLEEKRARVLKRYRFYEMKNVVPDFHISTPPPLWNKMAVLGWCGQAVDSLADRLSFIEFENDNFGFNEIFAQNNQDIMVDSAILSALIGSCSFVYISPDEDGNPRMQIIDGSNATGIIDPITYLLTEGYAVLERDQNDKPLLEAYFTPERTVFYTGNKTVSIANASGQTLLVPIIYKPDAKRLFGHSRITRACMSYVESAARTVKRSEISAEFFSFPQKYVSGLSEGAEVIDKWKAAMSSMMAFEKDEDGGHPVVGQFQQQSMSPHVDQLKMFASLFAGESGLTLDDIGFTTDNPASAEAIKAAHDNLRLMARKAQKCFGIGLINSGYVAACLRDKTRYNRSQIYQTRATWEPIFEPDAAMISGIGDGAIKLNNAVPGYFGKKNLRILTGIEAEQ